MSAHAVMVEPVTARSPPGVSLPSPEPGGCGSPGSAPGGGVPGGGVPGGGDGEGDGDGACSRFVITSWVSLPSSAVNDSPSV
ncbi:hypothetical protein ELQ90_03170 [Labedella phragmitis]|uniref:Uncharacterized protein n=1 Tax=Labedella phragmitis TaxID=2498849 RepID=A0A3S4APD5_9MICO|nr:hypothetical protein ELQ90_03170 [Labedella phragmitis]